MTFAAELQNVLIIRTFLKNREAIIKLSAYLSPAFKIDIGVPRGSVLSPRLFGVFLSDFLGEEPCHYTFAGDSAILIQGSNERDISKQLDLSCRGIEKWCNKWRMCVNGSKTELFLLNSASNISVSILNNEECAIKRVTKSIGLLIGYKLSSRRNKAKRCWDRASRVLSCKWSSAVLALVLLYKTIIVQQLLYASELWFEKNRNTVLRVQNHCIRTFFRNCFNPTVSTCDTLLGIPSTDLYNGGIEVKFVVKVIKASDLLSNTHSHFRYIRRSKSAALESKLFKFRKFLGDQTLTEYSKQDIDHFI